MTTTEIIETIATMVADTAISWTKICLEFVGTGAGLGHGQFGVENEILLEGEAGSVEVSAVGFGDPVCCGSSFVIMFWSSVAVGGVA